MLIFRYLVKEVFVTLMALLVILLLIFMSNQLVTYLTRAANGQIPGMLIMKLMLLELPSLTGLLLPLGFFVALLVAYGRMYAESEMVVLQACGYGPGKLLAHSFIMATLVALFVMILVVFLSPYIAIQRTRLLQTTGIQTIIQTIVPGRFHALAQGKQVFYVEQTNRSHTLAKNIFLARLGSNPEHPEQWEILWADKAFAKTDAKDNEDYLILQHGKEYQGTPGTANYQVATFTEYQARLPHPKLGNKYDIRTASAKTLWDAPSTDYAKAAELQWRLSIPIMVLTLTLAAIPFSRVNPRAGKYARLLPALVFFILYANAVFIARNWLAAGKVPVWVGIWWLHLLVMMIAAVMIWRNQVKLS